MNIYQIVCCVLSFFLNSALLVLIIIKSPKTLGFYKYIMIYTSIFEIVYSIWETITDPVVHSHSFAFITFRSVDSFFSREISFYMICIYCGFFGFSLALFGVHFVYRYGAIDNVFHSKYLSGSKVYFLLIIPFLYGAWWAGLCPIFANFNDDSDSYMKESIRNTFDLNIKEISYVFLLYHISNGDGTTYLNRGVFFMMICMWFMVLSSLYCVFYFGFQCYFKIAKTIDSSNLVSKLTRSLQKQLFKALVVQTLIPVILMYIPIAVLFMVPMLKLNLGFDNTFVCYTFATYPAIDPLPNMILIRKYRNAILDFIGFVIRRPRQHERSNTIDTVAQNTEMK